MALQPSTLIRSPPARAGASAFLHQAPERLHRRGAVRCGAGGCTGAIDALGVKLPHLPLSIPCYTVPNSTVPYQSAWPLRVHPHYLPHLRPLTLHQ
jgi:hypothetical protein